MINIVPLLQVSDEVIGHELRHQVVAVSEPAAPVMLKRKAQRETKLVGIGGGQFGSVIGHAGRLDQSVRTDQEHSEASEASCAHRHRVSHSGDMPDRSFPAVEALVRRVQRVAANRPDPLHILAQTIGMTGTIGMDPYAVLGVLVEGAVQTLIQHIPAERQADAAAMLVELLEERLKANGLASGDQHDL